MAYIGRGIENFSQIEVLDIITFTTSAGPYNITKDSVAFVPSTINSLLIEVDGIIQAPASYTISGSTITFGALMLSSSTMNSMIHFGTGLITTPADGTVTSAKLATSLSAIIVPTWESKSADFTAAAGKGYFCDTSSNDIDVTLPSPTIGDTIRFLDATGTFDTNDLTILNGSSKIQGASANLDISTERAGFALVYYNSTHGWLLEDK